MKALVIFTFLSILSSNLYAFDFNTNHLYNDFYECEFDGGQELSIHLHHMRITQATVEAFGQTFTGLGTFYKQIIVTDKTANYDEPITLHISMKDNFGGPDMLFVHTSQTRAPYSYKLICQKL